MAKFWALRKIFLYNMVLNKKNCSRLKTSPFDSIWLEISTNWHTTSQGPKKKSIKITKGRIDPCPAHTARNKGSFTTMVLWIAQRFLSSTVYESSYMKICNSDTRLVLLQRRNCVPTSAFGDRKCKKIDFMRYKIDLDTVKDKNLCTIHRTIVVKLP